MRTHRVELDVEGERTAVPELVGVSRGKLVLVNDDDLTYCALRLDPESLATAIDRHRRHRRAAAPHAVLVGGVGDDPRGRAEGPRLRHAGRGAACSAETEVGVAQRLLLQAQTALGSYADPDWACAEGWPPFADRLLELARAAEPGSDHQLAYVNALCTSVLALRHVEVLAALLDTDPAETG